MVLLTTVSSSIEEVGVDEKVIVRLIRYAEVVNMTTAVLQFDTESRYAPIAIDSIRPIDAPPSILLIPGEGMVILSYKSDHVIFDVLVRTRFEILRYGSGGTLEYDSSNTSIPFGTLTDMEYELWSPRWAKTKIMIKATRTSNFANVYEPSLYGPLRPRPFARPQLYPIELQQLTLPTFLI
jgi:hypothetical protein